ncbi:ABC transporter permease [Aerococcus agrisoli]|uniref:ABC transporter permease n=1 Tax=Aerococcus agrisoli TaxID=2487350 RepID=A0A3N4GA94_9LACT|nr:ABC transporter permease [Aerococcus agrisoli]RPA55901.1 ABC transporter permease [Aerococcus agrisoli]
MKKAFLAFTPAILVLLVTLFIPLLILFISTISWNSSQPFDQYIAFFSNGYNLTVLWRTIRISILVMVICALLGVPTAYYISGLTDKWRKIAMAITVFPLLTNSAVRAFAWINILGKNGVINNSLMSLGIIQQPLDLLYAELAIIIGSVYLFLPTMILALVGVMDAIDDEIIEAASTLGSNQFNVFFKIIFPLSLPGVVVGAILVFTGTMTAYTTPQLLGGNKYMMLSTYLRQNAVTLGNWEAAGVIAFIMIFITLITNTLLNALAKRLDRRLGTEEA